MRWEQVLAWRDLLRNTSVAEAPIDLPEPTLRAAWDIALDAWTETAFDRIALDGLVAYERAAMVSARTVPTAVMEWCAVLLGRGSEVTIKHPRGAPGLVPLLATTAAKVGLPLNLTDQAEALKTQDLVVSMGSDTTVQTIAEALPPETSHVALGHRFSIAWVTGSPSWEAIAQDIALHDSRGCMSPAVVFVQGEQEALEASCHHLVEALDAVGQHWPRGVATPLEHAKTRARSALSHATTGLALQGKTCRVHGLLACHFEPESLPRCPAVIAVEDVRTLASCLTPWKRWLSTVGTNLPVDEPTLIQSGAHRVCGLGDMQRPPLIRMHDGIDWIAATGRRTP